MPPLVALGTRLQVRRLRGRGGHRHGVCWVPPWAPRMGVYVGTSRAVAPPLVSRVNARPQVAASEALPVPLPLCWLCRTFLARAEAAIPKEKLAVAATQLCRVLPAVVAGACQCLAQRYAVLALEGVLGRLVPRLLCHTLLACRPEDGYPSLSPPRHPLGDTAAPPVGACAGTEVSGVTGRGQRCRASSRGRAGGGSRSPAMSQPQGTRPGVPQP